MKNASNRIMCTTILQHEAIVNFLVSKICGEKSSMEVRIICHNNYIYFSAQFIMQLVSFCFNFVYPKVMCLLIMEMFNLNREEVRVISIIIVNYTIFRQNMLCTPRKLIPAYLKILHRALKQVCIIIANNCYD